MPDHDLALLSIESAQRATPLCSTCGQHTVTVPYADGSVWVECASNGRSPIRQLLTFHVDALHTRRRAVAADLAA